MEAKKLRDKEEETRSLQSLGLRFRCGKKVVLFCRPLPHWDLHMRESLIFVLGPEQLNMKVTKRNLIWRVFVRLSPRNVYEERMGKFAHVQNVIVGTNKMVVEEALARY